MPVCEKANKIRKNSIKVLMRGTAGFTLMEIMVVIALIAAFGSMVAPTFNSYKLTEDAFSFVNSVRAARYGALESQVFHRVLIVPAEDKYLVQRYSPTSGWVHIVSESAADYSDESNTNWVSILDDDEAYFSPGVTFESGVNLFFVRPDGMLVMTPSYDALFVPDMIATFSYVESVITVNISSIGVMSSEEYNEY